MEFEKTSDREEKIAAEIVDAAYSVHKALGPGLLEKVHEVCFCHELTKRGPSCQRQMNLPIVYDGITFDVPHIRSIQCAPKYSRTDF